jgi:hypothetical protein
VAVPSEPIQIATTTSTQTPTSETSKYQDEQWLTSYENYVHKVANDMDKISTASSKGDFYVVSRHSDSLDDDSRKALDESNSYSVSPDLQNIKEEYQALMVDSNNASIFTRTLVKDFTYGNMEDTKVCKDEIGKYTKSFDQHASAIRHLLVVSNYEDFVLKLEKSNNYPQDSASETLSTPSSTSVYYPSQTSSSTNTDELCYASSKSDVYHSADCRYVSRIKSQNLIVFQNRQEAEAAGYRPCKVCGG